MVRKVPDFEPMVLVIDSPHAQLYLSCRRHPNSDGIKTGLLTYGLFCPSLSRVTGKEFIQRLKALGKRRGVGVVLVASRGKGSHQTLYYGERRTIVRNPKDELKTGTYHAMLKQLGITENELNG